MPMELIQCRVCKVEKLPRHGWFLDTFVTSFAKEVVGLSVCLFVCLWTTLLKKL